MKTLLAFFFSLALVSCSSSKVRTEQPVPIEKLRAPSLSKTTPSNKRSKATRYEVDMSRVKSLAELKKVLSVIGLRFVHIEGNEKSDAMYKGLSKYLKQVK